MPFQGLDQDLNSDEERLLWDGADTADWDWQGLSECGWKEVNGECRKFYDFWRGNVAYSYGKNFPNTLSFHGSLPFSSAGSKILVTGSYNDIFHYILLLRQLHPEVRKGVVLTGQPGVGKSTFLVFMLMQLMRAKQAILLCNSFKVFLFYRGQVFSRPTASGFDDIPTLEGYPVWTLVDVDYEDHGPPFDAGSAVWPIQATSPNPARFKLWCRMYQATVLGMRLWNMEELMEGLPLNREYSGFREALQHKLQGSDGPIPPAVSSEAIEAALQVLQTEREREMKTDDGTKPMDTNWDQEVEEAFQILVRNATEEFGFSPSDVYGGIFDPYTTKRRHADALRHLDYLELEDLLRSFSRDRRLSNPLHHIVALHPSRAEMGRSDIWDIKPKSTRIAKGIVERMQSQEEGRLREMYGNFHRFAEGSALAGLVFKAIVHRVFFNGWRFGPPMPQRVLMAQSNNPPLFSVDPSSLSTIPGTQMLPPPLCANARTTIRVDFTTKALVPNVTLQNDVYYIPAAQHCPLFDSFTIDADKFKSTARISIFHISISPTHQGSTDSYHLIHEIMNRVRELLKAEIPDEEIRDKTEVEIEVVYFLVCPEDEYNCTWQMPAGWDRDTTDNEHRGNVYLLRIPTLKSMVCCIYPPLTL